MTQLEDALEKAQTQLQRLIITLIHQYEQITTDKLQQLTGERLLALLPTLRRLQEKDAIHSPQPDLYTISPA